MYFFSHYEGYDPAVLNDLILELSLLFEAERRIKLQRNLTAFEHNHPRIARAVQLHSLGCTYNGSYKSRLLYYFPDALPHNLSACVENETAQQK